MVQSTTAPPHADTGELTAALEQLATNDAQQQAAACVILALKANQLRQGDRQLTGAVPRLVDLLSSEEALVQRNACTALANAIETQETCWQRALECSAAVPLVRGIGSHDEVLATNSLAACGSMVEGGPQGAAAFVGARGIEATVQVLIAAGGGSSSSRLVESALDVVCKLSSNCEEHRGPLVDKGAVRALAPLLASADNDVVVRVLVALVTLIAQKDTLLQLGDCAAGVRAITQRMRQTDDEDCRQLALMLFQALGSHADSKAKLLAVMKETAQEPVLTTAKP